MKWIIVYESGFIASVKRIDGKLKKKIADQIEILKNEPLNHFILNCIPNRSQEL